MRPCPERLWRQARQALIPIMIDRDNQAPAPENILNLEWGQLHTQPPNAQKPS